MEEKERALETLGEYTSRVEEAEANVAELESILFRTIDELRHAKKMEKEAKDQLELYKLNPNF